MTHPGDIPTQSDVVILGGGLAGLTLALQLAQSMPKLAITVLERKALPRSAGDHKVGESTVEIGAHYLSTVLGLRDHLEAEHLRKFGLRCFFNQAAGHTGLDQAAEIGGSNYLAHPSYQIDRVRLENHMAQRATALGVTVIGGARVRNTALGTGGAAHQITVAIGEHSHRISTGWVVDASGRAGSLKRQLKLERPNPHVGHAVWFKLPVVIDVNDWSACPNWLDRVGERGRLLSTNHLMGAGYWVWIIPLQDGHTSIGIVADPTLHDVSLLKDMDAAQAWFAEHEPQLAQAIAPHVGSATNYRRLRDYSYNCGQLFSAERWALTGEAGLFLDPFYSPGTDFIAISNGYITDLIERDQAGQRLAGRAAIYNDLYASFYKSTLTLYQNQLPLFGQPRVMTIKITWDFFYYWAILALLYCQGRMTDVALLGKHKDSLIGLRQLNRQVQALLQRWSRAEQASGTGQFFDQLSLPWMKTLNRQLTEPLGPAELSERLEHNIAELRAVAAEINLLVATLHPQVDRGALAELADLPCDGPRHFAAHWAMLTGEGAQAA